MLQDKLKGLSRPEIPEAYQFLYTPKRYKVVYGGRGKAASWSYARVLVDMAHTRKLFIVCGREFQNSIKESVYRLIVEQIRLLGYGQYFHITQTSIKSLVSGSEFVFKGLNEYNADNIKSLEGCNIFWMAEAHKTSARSWKILIPTIRAPGSEIWVDYNPDEEEADTHQRFAVNPPNNSIVKCINFDQNPFFPPELEEERQNDLQRIANARTEEEREQAQLDYDNIWLGAPRRMSMAAIFGARCRFEVFDTPADAEFMHGADWGYAADPTVLIRCYESKDGTMLYIDMEAFGYGVELDDIPALFDRIPTARKYRIEADCARPETISHVSRRGFDVIGAEKWQGSVEDGIAFLKAYKWIVIHATNCPEMVKEAKSYCWKQDKVTGQILPVPVDAYNHGFDACRYALGKRIKRKPKGFFDV